MSRALRLTSLLLALGAPACSSPTVAGAPLVFVTLVGGDNQTGPVGTVLSAPFIIRVQDETGAPVVGRRVRWAAVLGGGVVAPAENVTGRRPRECHDDLG